MAIFNYRLSWARHTVEYAEDHAIMLPGWIPGYKRFDLQLLPCPVTKRSIWKCYKDAADLLQDFSAVAYPTFCKIWTQVLPNILPTHPMTDLCMECHKMAGLI